MNLIARYRRLSPWNKVAFWGSIASILGVVWIVKDAIWHDDPVGYQVVKEAEESGYKRAQVEAICTLDSLEALNSQIQQENENFRQLQREQAECFAQSARTVFEKAQVQIGLRQYDSALYYLKLAVTANSEDSSFLGEVYFFKGVCHYLRDGSEASLPYWDSALFYRHDHALTWYNRGVTSGKSGDYEEALRSYDSSLSYNDSEPDVWFNSGDALEKLRRYKEAAHSFKMAIKYGHDYIAWGNLGAIYGKLEQYNEELACYDTLLNYRRSDPILWLNKGTSLIFLNRFQEAIASFDSALSYKNSYPDAWYNQAVAYYILGNYDSALLKCDSALKYDANLKGTNELRQKLMNHLSQQH